ncbi:HU family DNA-binding protein [Pseudoalteromonas xiamenensis]|uniref:HU family DNA-binding protein n=1 Tax=Pseudoalteromonas xiamenensis TaxID=882626 RepID=A0A975HJP9_9GAMM|nr:HU family DNA-binding protein [Pseudoalteromonas xiamenensis]QTH70119.1 HU family DNA-binding protein [Pseudoalteromonas xiamenensis]QTH71449.1 HU family DNA-binding protein [Pseudoalteromonas xiamenensis]
MNKKSLVELMSAQAELPKTHVNAALNSLLAIITKRLSEGDQVQLHNLGTFTLSYHPAKEGRNPQTGEKILIEGANKVLFKPAKALKEALSN